MPLALMLESYPRVALTVWVLLAAVGSVPYAHAQYVRYSSAASAMAGPVAVQGLWPGAVNPASLGGTAGSLISAHVARPYHMPSLVLSRLHVGFGGRNVSVAGSLERFGYDAYSRTGVGLASAGAWGVTGGAEVAAGGRVSLSHAAPRGYEAFISGRLDAGWIASFDSLVSIGAAIGIPISGNRASVNRAGILAAGVSARVHGTTRVSVRVEREDGFPASLGIGAELGLAPSFLLRTGMTTAPAQLCGGVGIRVSRLVIDVSIVSHQALGLSSSITLSYRSE